MLRRYNLTRSDNFPATGAAVVLSNTVVLEDEDLIIKFSPTVPSLVTRINLNFSRGNFLSDIDATAYITGATPYPVTLFSETNSSKKIAWILSPQSPLHMLPGDHIDIFAGISESTKSSSSLSSGSSRSSVLTSESSSDYESSQSSTSESSLGSSFSTEQVLPSYICVSGAGHPRINGTYDYVGSNAYLNQKTGAVLNSGATLPADWGFSFEGDDIYLSTGSSYRPEGQIYTSINAENDPPPEVVTGICPSETSSQSFSSSSSSSSSISSDSSTSISSSSSIEPLKSKSSSSSSENSSTTFSSNSSSKSSVMTSVSTESTSSSSLSSLNSSSTEINSTSSASSTGFFRVVYEIHYIPLYQLSESEAAATSTLT